MDSLRTRIPELLGKHEASLLSQWVSRQRATEPFRAHVVGESDRRDDSRQFLLLVRQAAAAGVADIHAAAWAAVREFLVELSDSRARAGASSSETAMFVLTLKQPVFDLIRTELGNDASAIADALWTTTLLDALGLFTIDVYQRSREAVIARQQEEMLELSTPVVTLWDGVLAVPLIGTLDSARTQIVMESLLEKIVDTGASIAIIDITGVPTVDTLVAQHLLQTVAAARLMGADCIISGIRPQIAQTIVHLGVDLGNVTTKATLADAFRVALARTGSSLTRARTA